MLTPHQTAQLTAPHQCCDRQYLPDQGDGPAAISPNGQEYTCYGELGQPVAESAEWVLL